MSENKPEMIPEQGIPETAPALHDWIVAELGDTELARRIKQRPDLTQEFLKGNMPPAEGFFELIYDISASDPELANKLAEFAEHNDRFVPLSYQRVEGATSNEERSSELLRGKFFATKNLTEKVSGEREKTILELAMVSFADDITNKYRERFGQETFLVNPKQVRIIDHGVLEDERYDGVAPVGKFNFFDQGLKIAGGGNDDRMKLNLITHEMFHFKAYGAIQKYKDQDQDTRVAKLRFGLGVYESYAKNGAVKATYFNWLNEAVTEDLANRVLARVSDDHPIFGEFVKTNRAKAKAYFSDDESQSEFLKRSEFVAGFEKDEDGKEVPIAAYIEERRMMYGLFGKMIEKNSSELAHLSHFDGQEYLFEMLTKAYFTGNILPFGRLFNDTFGRGQFREFGHLQTVEEQKAFIDAL